MNSIGQPPRWSSVRGQRTLGVVMIVSNEVQNLPALFETIRDVADEVVVVDTGSTDGTRAVCKAWGVTLLNDPWRNDFSQARNRSIQAATSKYLLWLDADDRLPHETQRELIRMRDEVLPRAERCAYEFEVHNTDAAGAVRDTFVQTRVFPRLREVRFQHAIHEEIITSLDRAGIERESTPLVIVHTGYASPEEVERKNQRNQAILRRSLQAHGASVHHLVHLAYSVSASGEVGEAEELLGRAIELEESTGPRRELLAELYALRASFVLARSDRLAAIYDLEQAISLDPHWAVPRVQMAEVRVQEKDWTRAWQAIEQARSGVHRAGVLGLGSRRSRSLVERLAGFVLKQQDRPEEALECLGRAVQLDPFHLEARLELGQTLLDREEFTAAREVLEPAGEDEAAADRFVEVAAAIGLARAMTGELESAGACLAPLLEIFAPELDGAENASPLELSKAMLRTGHPAAARNMLVLYQRTLQLT